MIAPIRLDSCGDLTSISVFEYRFLYSIWLFFFFSSRRRHTRLQGDWSSDVCSSDLRRTTASRGARVLAALALAGLLTACGHDGYTPSGPWRPLPEGAPPEVSPPTD